ncbi:probable serine incorporator isoform X2 [Punica granatum]|nr:probable serine incorporator isoform X2 [Punica granatum]OWM77427.1 hypothetical protein CDL15_Pgr016824 [Punica granatum]
MGEPAGGTSAMLGDIVIPNNVEIYDRRNCVLSRPTCEQKMLDLAVERRQSLRARYYYGMIFLFMNLGAWFVRDYGQKLMPILQYVRSCGMEGLACTQTMGVLRVSLGCFIFFFLMFLISFNTRKLNEARNIWHSRWWALKSLLLIVSMATPLLIPSSFIHFYGEFARVGAGIFLVLQLISVIQFIAWWNNHWMPDGGTKQSCSLGLLLSTLSYIASLCGIAILAKMYSAGQSLNIFFITWTIILLIVMMVMSLHSKVNTGLLSSGIMGSYIVFLCWSAIRSEPAIQKSNVHQQANHHDWSTIFSFVIAICAIVMATFSTGIDSESFQFRKDDIREEDDVPYKYEFFHLVFSLGAMYFAMLFISWNLENTTTKWVIDVGWASTWVKIINEWLGATIYMWTLISPAVRRAKVMDEESAEVNNNHTGHSTSSPSRSSDMSEFRS